MPPSGVAIMERRRPRICGESGLGSPRWHYPFLTCRPCSDDDILENVRVMHYIFRQLAEKLVQLLYAVA